MHKLAITLTSLMGAISGGTTRIIDFLKMVAVCG